MEKKIAFQRFSKALTLLAKVINTKSEEQNGGSKLTKVFWFFMTINVSSLFVTFAYCWLEDPGFSVVTEVVAVNIVYVRSIFNVLIISLSNAKWQSIFRDLIIERKSVRKRDVHFALTLSYCKTEFNFIRYWVILYLPCGITAFLFNPILHLNNLRLPLNFYIPWLQFEDSFGWKWWINYFYQVTTVTSLIVFITAYFPLTLVLIDQVCLEADVVKILVKNLNKTITDFPDKTNAARNSEIDELIKTIARMTIRLNEWKKEVSGLMRFNFLIELTALSYSFCSGIFTLSENFYGSFTVLLAMYVIMGQLYVYCWIGSRFEARVNQLSATLYDIEWHEMSAKSQKDLQLILLMTQDLKGFDGVFKNVNLQTFQKVVEYSYSLLAFLKSTK